MKSHAVMKIHPILFLFCWTVFSCREPQPAGDDVLDNFEKVDSSLSATSATMRSAAENLLDSIGLKTKEAPSGEALEWQRKAAEVMKMSAALKNHIEGIKRQLQQHPEDAIAPVDDLMVKNNAGYELLKKMDAFNKDVLTVDVRYSSMYGNDPAIDLQIPKDQSTWAAFYFQQTPVFAAVTLLSKWQNDISNEEMRFVHFCLQQLNNSD